MQAGTFTVYIDFDSTLFETRRFSQDLRRAIAEQTGIAYEQLEQDTIRFVTSPGLGGYEFEAHMAAYGLDTDAMWKLLATTLEQDDYLFPDSVVFMQGLRADGYDPKILSFGEEHFQRAKIVPSLPRLIGAAEHESVPLDFQVVYRRKNEHLADVHSGEQGVLVDDVPGQDLPEGFTEIHLDRKRELSEPEVIADGFIVSNLAQARQAIQRIHPQT